jgi:hypothetical protein
MSSVKTKVCRVCGIENPEPSFLREAQPKSGARTIATIAALNAVAATTMKIARCY